VAVDVSSGPPDPVGVFDRRRHEIVGDRVGEAACDETVGEAQVGAAGERQGERLPCEVFYKPIDLAELSKAIRLLLPGICRRTRSDGPASPAPAWASEWDL